MLSDAKNANQRTSAKDLVKILEETVTKGSISTVKYEIISTKPERLLSKEATDPKQP